MCQLIKLTQLRSLKVIEPRNLLDLPYEIRNLVLEHVFRHTKTLSLLCFSRLHDANWHRKLVTLGILGVNKQLRQEALEVLYRVCEFSFNLIQNEAPLVKWDPAQLPYTLSLNSITLWNCLRGYRRVTIGIPEEGCMTESLYHILDTLYGLQAAADPSQVLVIDFTNALMGTHFGNEGYLVLLEHWLAESSQIRLKFEEDPIRRADIDTRLRRRVELFSRWKALFRTYETRLMVEER